MEEIKVSFVATVKNEEASIGEFLDSLLTQSRQPDEIVIIDGGSSDRTVKVISSYIRKGAPIKLIIEEGVNIARGRNIAIENTKHEVIAVSDAGCRLDKNWLKNLIEPFEKDSSFDVVAGWYEAKAETNLEKCAKILTCHELKEVLKNPEEFLPPNRSVAFKKNAWKRVGGYPEWLTFAAEDTLFNLNLKRAGCKFTFVPEAVVYWKLQNGIKGLMKQLYRYGLGEGEARILTKEHLRTIPVLLFPPLMIFSKKRFKCFGLRYLGYWAIALGWLRGLLSGRRPK